MKDSLNRNSMAARNAAWIRMLGFEEAQGRLAEIYRRLWDPAKGPLDHILRIHSLHPRALEAHLGLYKTVMQGTATLPKLEREMIALVVSRLNGCHY